MMRYKACLLQLVLEVELVEETCGFDKRRKEKAWAGVQVPGQAPLRDGAATARKPGTSQMEKVRHVPRMRYMGRLKLTGSLHPLRHGYIGWPPPSSGGVRGTKRELKQSSLRCALCLRGQLEVEAVARSKPRSEELKKVLLGTTGDEAELL